MTGHVNWQTWDKHRDCRGPHQGSDGWLRRGQYEDLPTDAPPEEDKTDDEPEGLDDGSSAAGEHETRQVKRKFEMQTSSSSSLARPGGETVHRVALHVLEAKQ